MIRVLRLYLFVYLGIFEMVFLVLRVKVVYFWTLVGLVLVGSILAFFHGGVDGVLVCIAICEIGWDAQWLLLGRSSSMKALLFLWCIGFLNWKKWHLIKSWCF